MNDALFWGAVSASSLMVGTILGLIRRWPERFIGWVLAFGGGALIASIAFELSEAAVELGGPIATAIGMAVGALLYFFGDVLLEGRPKPTSEQADAMHDTLRHRQHASRRRRKSASTAGTALALGALLDGMPEQVVLGIEIATGGSVSLGLLIAIFVSNIPEAMGSAADMRQAGTARGKIFAMWSTVTILSVIASGFGYLLAANVGPEMQASINGIAGGALLVMLVDSLFPEAREKGGRMAGLITVLGFALGAGLSLLT